MSERFYGEYKHGGLADFQDAFMNLDSARAPLVPALYAVAYMLAGNVPPSALIVNYLSLVVLCLSVYGIGRRLGGPWCGLAAAWVTMMFPMMFGLVRQTLVEFPLAAAAAFVAYLCVSPKALGRYGIGVLLGIMIGAGMLIKVSFPMFVIGPLLAACVTAVALNRTEGAPQTRQILLTLAIMVLEAFAIAAPWLIHNADVWFGFARDNAIGYWGMMFGGSNASYLEALAGPSLFYIHVPIIMLLIVAGIVLGRRVAVRRSSFGKERTVALVVTVSWFAIPLVVGLCTRDKDPRLLAPIYPALGILLAYLYVRLAARRVAVIAAGLLLTLVVPYYGVSFSGPPYPPDISRVDTSSFSYVDYFRPWFSADLQYLSPSDIARFYPRYFLGKWACAHYIRVPNGQDWKSDEIVSAIDSDILQKYPNADPVDVGVLRDNVFFYPAIFSYFHDRVAIEGGHRRANVQYHLLPWNAECTGDPERMLAQHLFRCNVVLTREPDAFSIPEAVKLYDRMMELLSTSKYFVKVKLPNDIVLPGGSKVIIYRQKDFGHVYTDSEMTQIIVEAFDTPH
jgi:hypothetical protein